MKTAHHCLPSVIVCLQVSARTQRIVLIFIKKALGFLWYRATWPLTVAMLAFRIFCISHSLWPCKLTGLVIVCKNISELAQKIVWPLLVAVRPHRTTLKPRLTAKGQPKKWLSQNCSAAFNENDYLRFAIQKRINALVLPVTATQTELTLVYQLQKDDYSFIWSWMKGHIINLQH